MQYHDYMLTTYEVVLAAVAGLSLILAVVACLIGWGALSGLRRLPNRAEMVAQKASWASAIAEWDDLAERIVNNLKKLGARTARSLDAGLLWDGPESSEEGSEGDELDQFDLIPDQAKGSSADFWREKLQ